MTRLLAGLMLVPILAILAYHSFYVVNERDQAAVLRFGKVVQVRSEPGLYLKFPLPYFGADRVRKFEDRLLRYDLGEIRVQVSSGKFYEVSAFVVYRIADARQFLETVSGDLQLANERLRTRFDAALRQVYGLNDFEAALSKERRRMMDEVAADMQTGGRKLGLQVADVRIERTELTEAVTGQTFERMKAERFAAAELIRARGREASQRVRAVADRQAVGIIASATREALILRGEGEGERAKVFATAYSKAPRFFDFYRSMKAYEKALPGTGTTFVLSPNSGFFEYFTSPGGSDISGSPGNSRPTGRIISNPSS